MDNKVVLKSQDQLSESSFISKVYLWMSFGLFLSAAAAMMLLSSPTALNAIVTNKFLFFGLMIAELGLVMWLSMAIYKMSSMLATLLFCAYSALNGVTIALILLIYTGASVMSTFAITGATFLFFSIYGATTKKDLTSVGSLAMMGLFGVLIASLVNMFLHSTGLMWVITYVGVGVFLGLIAYDTQKLKSIHAMGFESEEMRKKAAIMGALALYLDFINLFIMLLRIFGKRRD